MDRRTSHQISSREMDTQSVINWTVVSQLSWQYLRASTVDCCNRDRQALSTARFCRATADTCSIHCCRRSVRWTVSSSQLCSTTSTPSTSGPPSTAYNRPYVAIANETVPKILTNYTRNLFFETAISILVISSHNSFRVLVDKIASVYFSCKNIFIF